MVEDAKKFAFAAISILTAQLRSVNPVVINRKRVPGGTRNLKPSLKPLARVWEAAPFFSFERELACLESSPFSEREAKADKVTKTLSNFHTRISYSPIADGPPHVTTPDSLWVFSYPPCGGIRC